ncbi:MAG: ABC transporter substrate-binding protein [Clostridiales bacterium]|nr:ABC transporter substrate-binding protein [Clostridiales bacterium]
MLNRKNVLFGIAGLFVSMVVLISTAGCSVNAERSESLSAQADGTLSGNAEAETTAQADSDDAAADGAVEIPIILMVSPTSGIRSDEDLVEAFNEAYEGTYYLDVEWVMETEQEERQNMKRLNVTDDLPAILTSLRLLPSFYNRMTEEGRVEDLSSYINSDAEWRNMIEEEVLESVTEDDGSIYLAPESTMAFSCSGIFWNEELFAEAGISEFPETWEEFWECCDRLQAAGITPLALHTEGTAWVPMLLATAKAAETEEGAEFLKTIYPETYQNETGTEIAETLQKLFSYTTDDAMYEDFDVAYTHFFSGDAAMIANGYWMIDEIPDEMADTVRFSTFPGNVLISSPETFGWALVSSYSDEVKEGVIEFFKFRTQQSLEEKEQLFADGAGSSNRALTDYLEAYNNAGQFIPNYQANWNSILQEETLGTYLPLLIEGKITVEEFTAAEDESIAEFNAEN